MPQNPGKKVLAVNFYKSTAGNEPVREWLKLRSPEEKRAIGEDIKAVEFAWPIGYPQVVKLDKDLWEVRTNLPDGICRVFLQFGSKTWFCCIASLKRPKKHRNKI